MYMYMCMYMYIYMYMYTVHVQVYMYKIDHAKSDRCLISSFLLGWERRQMLTIENYWVIYACTLYMYMHPLRVCTYMYMYMYMYNLLHTCICTPIFCVQ